MIFQLMDYYLDNRSMVTKDVLCVVPRLVVSMHCYLEK